MKLEIATPLKPAQGPGHGTPFISSLVLRYLDNDHYIADFGSLHTFARLDFGDVSEPTRFGYDMYDRE